MSEYEREQGEIEAGQDDERITLVQEGGEAPAVETGDADDAGKKRKMAQRCAIAHAEEGSDCHCSRPVKTPSADLCVQMRSSAKSNHLAGQLKDADQCIKSSASQKVSASICNTLLV